jgi:cell division protein FtsA
MGVTLVDIGGGATTVSVYQQGALWNAAVLPLGGYQFTTDLAVALNTPYATAEEVKLRHGQASLDNIDDENVEIQAFGDRRTVRVERRVISRYLHDRAEELFRLIGMKVRGFGFPALPPAGIVLTGGGATLPGIERVARRILGTPVRISGPEGLNGLPEGMIDPAYVASAGTLLWGTRHLASIDSARKEERRLNKNSGYAQNNAGPLSWFRERVRKVAL